jgi:ABC-2 type transport system permease protein
VTSATPGALRGASAEPVLPEDSPLAAVRQLLSRMVTLCCVELRKIRHDRTEMYTRAIQPALWLVIFGETFTRIHAIAADAAVLQLQRALPGAVHARLAPGDQQG